MRFSTFAVIPAITLAASIFAALILGFSSKLAFNPPYLLLILNVIFWTLATSAILYTSAKSYVRNGSRTVFLISTSILIFGSSVIVSGWVSEFSGPKGVAVSNPCLFVSSILQVIAGALSFAGKDETPYAKRKLIIAIAYIGALAFVGVNSTLAIFGALPPFFTSSGPTLLRQVILGSAVALFGVAFAIFGLQFIRSKVSSLFWYALSLALICLGLFSAFEVKALGDVLTWLGRLSLYIGTIYLIIAIIKSGSIGSDRVTGWTEAFRNDRQQLEILFSKMLNGFSYHRIIVDGNGKPVDYIFLAMNAAFEKMTGLKREDVVGKRVTQVLHGIENDPADWIGTYGKVALTGQPATFENFAAVLGRWYSVSAYSPRKSYFVAIFEDVTERKKAEEALKESEQLYKTIFDNRNDGFVLVEPIYDENNNPFDIRFLQINLAYEKQTGTKAANVEGKRAKEVAPNLEQEWISLSGEVAKTGQTRQIESFNLRTNKWYDANYIPFSRGRVGILFRDVTERKKLEKQVKDSERLAAIGATAGMVGHDIRNPLQAIISDVYLAKSDLSSLPDVEDKKNVLESLEGIENNVLYIDKIVQDLQDYAKPLAPIAKEIYLDKVFESALIKNVIPDNIKATYEVDAKAKTCIADPEILRRIFANLVSNAVQAMPDGGKLTMKACREGEELVLSVEDTGVGIPEEDRGKIFTPLFTTKSKGQGLGLAVVKRLVEALGGTINYESEVEKGTKFILRLPPPKEINGKLAFR